MCTIESRATRDHQNISLGHSFIFILSLTHQVKIGILQKSPTHYPCGLARTYEWYLCITMKMEILLEPTSSKLMVGDLWDSWKRIKLVIPGKQRWCDSLWIKLVPGYELTINDTWKMNFYIKLSMGHKTTLASDLSIDFQKLIFFYQSWRMELPIHSYRVVCFETFR